MLVVFAPLFHHHMLALLHLNMMTVRRYDQLKVNFVSPSKMSETGSLQNVGYQHQCHKMDHYQFMK
jgi:hypothetical protein